MHSCIRTCPPHLCCPHTTLCLCKTKVYIFNTTRRMGNPDYRNPEVLFRIESGLHISVNTGWHIGLDIYISSKQNCAAVSSALLSGLLLGIESIGYIWIYVFYCLDVHWLRKYFVMHLLGRRESRYLISLNTAGRLVGGGCQNSANQIFTGALHYLMQ